MALLELEPDLRVSERGPSGLRGSDRRVRLLPLWLVIAAASLWVRSGFPVYAIGFASLDDLLFIRLAKSLGVGRWLGQFNEGTLVKGAFYPMFILASFAAGIPLKWAEQAVYLGAAAGVAWLVSDGGRRRWLATALFVALAFDPVFWNNSLSRVIREGLYTGLSLAVFGAALAVAAGPVRTMWASAGRGALLGALAGAFWLTREEGIWLLPAVAVVLLWGVARAWRSSLGRLLPPLVVAGLVMGAMIGGVVAMNWRVYGVAETVDVKSGPFQRAYGAISRIAHDQWRRYVVFPTEARALAYRVSPAARELRPFFEGEPSAAWRRVGCAEMPNQACSEILAPWFQWALRDMVTRAGYYRTAPETAAFYDRLAGEIDAACDSGAIPCLPARATMAPPFHGFYLRDAVSSGAAMLALLSTVGGEQVAATPSDSAEPRTTEFANMVGPIARAPRQVMEFLGTIGLAEGVPTLSLHPESGVGSWVADIVVQPPNEADPRPGGQAMTRFSISTDCPLDRCELIVAAGGRELDRLRLDAIKPGRSETPGYTLEFASPRPVLLDREADLRDRAIQGVARVIGRGYAAVLPWLLVAGLAGVVVAIVLRRGVGSPLFAVAVGSLVAVLSRVALLAYVDVTTIASINILYLSPAAPFVIAFAVAGVALPWRVRG